MSKQVVLMASGTGSLAQAVIDAVKNGDIQGHIAAIITDQPAAQVVERAHIAEIPIFIHPMNKDRVLWNAQLIDLVDSLQPDLVVSVGFMRILSRDFVTRFPTINSHPSLLPAFPGAHAVADALRAGVKETGTTVHWVDEGVDTGQVIAQVPVAIVPNEQEAELHERIKIVERKLIVNTIQLLLSRSNLSSASLQPVGRNRMSEKKSFRRALVSVYDKTGLIEIGTALKNANVEILSTGSTAKTLRTAGLDVTEVGDYTGFPEIMGGRVKTLHPRIHGGILADQNNPEHLAQIASHDIAPIDLVVINLYPFAQTIATTSDFAKCIEQIDIGGPSMLRGAAKNHGSVAVICRPGQYSQLISAINDGGFTNAERRELALEVFRTTAEYDLTIANWLGSDEQFPEWLGKVWHRESGLRYGENPHQSAALYSNSGVSDGIVGARQLHGKEMSFNNYTDADAAWRAAHDHSAPCVAIIKHANPCGIAVADSIALAHKKAHECDSVSAFGGVVAANREVDAEMAMTLSEIFTEVVIAPKFSAAALEILMKKPSVRLLECSSTHISPQELRLVSGGVLVQLTDLVDAPGDEFSHWVKACGPDVAPADVSDLVFAWRAVRSVKSNAILLAKDGASVGVGMGQVNRVDSAKLAVARAGDRVRGSVAASDAFFPFPDGVEILLQAGVKVIVQPGGSIRDAEVIAAVEAAGATMYFTNVRHFSHA